MLKINVAVPRLSQADGVRVELLGEGSTQAIAATWKQIDDSFVFGSDQKRSVLQHRSVESALCAPYELFSI